MKWIIITLVAGSLGFSSQKTKTLKFMNEGTEVNEAKAPDSLIAPGSSLMLVSDQFAFTEGPAVDKKGNIYFTDQPNNRIWKYDIDGKLSLFMENAGRSNGLFIDKKGNILSCADEHNQLWSIDPKGKVKVLVTDVDGKKLNGPNDLWADGDGGIYFTDPYYQRDYWTRKSPEIKEQKVYYLSKKGKLSVATDDLVKPNGIVGSKDGKYLFIADIGDNKTYRYEIAGDGKLQNRKLFVNQGSDGIVLDNKGNLYLTGAKGVMIFDAQGRKIEDILVPGPWTANLCFGGREKNILFITSSKAVYTVKMSVEGIE